MNWIIDNLQIIATLGSALAVYISLKNVAKKDVYELKLEMNRNFADIRNDIQDIRRDIKDLNIRVQSLDSRVARIEGQMNPPPYHWEPKVYSKDQEPKNP